MKPKLSESDVTFGDLTEKNMGQLRKLNEYLYPVKYQDKFYKDVLAQGEWAQYVYLRDVLVGAYCCRVEMLDEGFRVYILTFGVLEAYRRLGIGARMLHDVLRKVGEQPGIKEIYLHVQVGNDAALAFYRGNGFVGDDVVPDYYKNIEPTGAILLRKCIRQ